MQKTNSRQLLNYRLIEFRCAAGNTCFVNVALQCLRYTPTLKQAIISDLLSLPAMDQQDPMGAESTEGSPVATPSATSGAEQGTELQSVPESRTLDGGLVQLISPSTSLNASSQPDAASHMAALPAHHSIHSMAAQSQGQSPPQHQLDTQPVGIPVSDHSLLDHDRSSQADQLSSSSPSKPLSDRLNTSSNGSGFSVQTTSIAESPVGIGTDVSTSGSDLFSDQPIDQQQPAGADSAQQGVASAVVEGDDSARGPSSNASTLDKQPPPVAIPRVPLKRGEIADSFKTLVKQVSPAHAMQCIVAHTAVTSYPNLVHCTTAQATPDARFASCLWQLVDFMQQVGRMISCKFVLHRCMLQ